MEFGARIRSLRQERGFTQEELAHRAGMSLKSVYFIETGRSQDPHWSSLKNIADALNVPVRELIEDPVAPLGEAPEAEGLTDEEIAQTIVRLKTPGAVSEVSKADMKKYGRYLRGSIVIGALEYLLDHAGLVLDRGVFDLEEIESLENTVAGQFYSHKYDPRREEVLRHGTPRQKERLEQEEARFYETLTALTEAYERRLEEEEAKAQENPNRADELAAKRRENEAKRQTREEEDRELQEFQRLSNRGA
jgi:transcriptional regulator with XRE-family HTH domain